MNSLRADLKYTLYNILAGGEFAFPILLQLGFKSTLNLEGNFLTAELIILYYFWIKLEKKIAK